MAELKTEPDVRRFRFQGRAHSVTASNVITGLSGQIDRHVGTRWVASIVFADGFGVTMAARTSLPLPAPHVCEWMEQSAIALNREATGGSGHWVVAINLRKGEPVLVWRDDDGDIRIAMEISTKGTTALEDYSPTRICELGLRALDDAHRAIEEMNLGRFGTIKLAQGEAPAPLSH